MIPPAATFAAPRQHSIQLICLQDHYAYLSIPIEIQEPLCPTKNDDILDGCLQNHLTAAVVNGHAMTCWMKNWDMFRTPNFQPRASPCTATVGAHLTALHSRLKKPQAAAILFSPGASETCGWEIDMIVGILLLGLSKPKVFQGRATGNLIFIE